MLAESSIAKGYGKLAQIKKELGFIPNLLQEMNTNPATLMVYLHGQEALANGVLTPREQQAVQLRVSLRNACHYCRAAHKWLGRQSGLPTEDIEIIGKGGLPKDERLAAILDATDLLMERKGWLSAEESERFGEAGSGSPQALRDHCVHRPEDHLELYQPHRPYPGR